jgi:hypothetical protein
MRLLTANRLGDGVVLWWTANGWAEDAALAIAMDEPEATDRLAAWTARETEVVGVYLIPVDEGGKPVRRETVRETVRANGPSTGPTQLDTAKRHHRNMVF